MTTAETILTVVGTLLAGWGMGELLKRGIAGFRDLVAGLKGIATIAESNKELVEVGRTVAMEVQLLRAMMAANVSQQPAGDGQDPREGEAGPTRPVPPPPFPTAPA